MARIICFAVILLLAISLSTGEDSTRLARQRQRVLHYRYPQTFRYKPDADEDEPPYRGGYRSHGRRRPPHNFELPTESRQGWRSMSSGRARAKIAQQQQHRRPVNNYGSPPVNWPLRTPSSRTQQHTPHDSYGPPAEQPPAASDDDIRDDVFRADYEDDQYRDDELQNLQKSKAQQQQQKPTVLQSEQYIGATQTRSESQKKQPEEDKIENFEIPLEFLRGS